MSGKEGAIVKFDLLMTPSHSLTYDNIKVIDERLFEAYAAQLLDARKNATTANPHQALYTADTIKKYMERIIELLKKRFEGDKFWYHGAAYCSTLVKDLENNYSRLKLKEGVPDKKANPLFGSELKSIVTNMLKAPAHSRSFTDAAITTTTYMGMGRGDEVRYLNWSSTTYHEVSTFGCIGTSWSENKTIREYPMAFCCHRNSLELDEFVLLGGMFSEGGLFRNTSMLDNDSIAATRWFASVPSFATHTSKILAKYFDDITKHVTSRSLRNGPVTEGMACSYILEKWFEMRGGWKTESNMKHYNDPQLVGTLPAGLFLAGWDEHHRKANPPSLPNYFSTGEWGDIADGLFAPISLYQFQKDGNFRPLLMVCLASIIRFYTVGIRLYKGHDNCAVMRLFDKLRKVVSETDKIQSDPSVNPHGVLTKLSAEVSLAFENNNLQESALTESGVLTLMNATTKRLSNVEKEVIDCKQELADFRDDVTSELAEMNATLADGLNAIRALLSRAVGSPIKKSGSPTKGSPNKSSSTTVTSPPSFKQQLMFANSSQQSEAADSNTTNSSSSSSSSAPGPPKNRNVSFHHHSYNRVLHTPQLPE